MSEAPTTAVFLAAGRGQRLRPYTDTVPKPLLCVDGRPTLDYVLRAAQVAGIERVCLVTHHLGEQIRAYVRDGAAWGMRIAYCQQDALLGTAHALQAAVRACPDWFDADRAFLLSATDYALPESYLRDLINAHMASDADLTASLKRMPAQEVVGRSTVRFRPDSSIAEIVEKPALDEVSSPYAASLTFVLPGDALEYIHAIPPSPRGELEIQAAINAMIRAGYLARGLEQSQPVEWKPHENRKE